MPSKSAFMAVMSVVSVFSFAMRSARVGSPMVEAEVVGGGERLLVGGAMEGEDAAGCDEEEDRETLDTRLSRALVPKDAGPRLRSSYSRSVVAGGVVPPHRARWSGYPPWPAA
jgi:hypothetical protein